MPYRVAAIDIHKKVLMVVVATPTPLQLEVLKLFLERLGVLDSQIEALDRLMAKDLKKHEEAVPRLAKAPGFGVDSAQQIIAEIGVEASAFPSADHFGSWFGGCPGSNMSAEENHSSRSPKGNRFVRRILTQAAQGAVRTKNSFFEQLFKRFLPKLGYNGAIWAVAHRLGRLVWKILHDGVDYIERGAETTPQAKKRLAQKLAQTLRRLGYTVTITPLDAEPSAELPAS